MPNSKTVIDAFIAQKSRVDQRCLAHVLGNYTLYNESIPLVTVWLLQNADNELTNLLDANFGIKMIIRVVKVFDYFFVYIFRFYKSFSYFWWSELLTEKMKRPILKLSLNKPVVYDWFL